MAAPFALNRENGNMPQPSFSYCNNKCSQPLSPVATAFIHALFLSFFKKRKKERKRNDETKRWFSEKKRRFISFPKNGTVISQNGTRFETRFKTKHISKGLLSDHIKLNEINIPIYSFS